jgi:phosphoribosylformimino-5-aminoimidazole carboxamide ribotide isomerase
MIIIPAIDIIDAKCVRLTKGDYNTQKTYNENPTAQAKIFEDAGFTHLHLVDLDGAKQGKVQNWKVLEEIANQTNLHIDFSGGIKTKEQAQRAFDLGAKQITVGSLAAKNPTEFVDWIWEFGEENLILGADVKNKKIAIQGWQENAEQDIFSFLDFYFEEGIDYVLCTDVSKDGMLEGAANELYGSILAQYSDIKLIASGGVSNLNDLIELKEIGCYAAVVGKAIYEEKITLTDIMKAFH